MILRPTRAAIGALLNAPSARMRAGSERLLLPGFVAWIAPGRRRDPCARLPHVLEPGLLRQRVHIMSAINPDLAILLRLLVAAALGAAVGFERETAGKSAGLRTHMLVCMSAAFFVALGEQTVETFSGGAPTSGALRYDPLRAIQAVVIGVGFLGSGIIFVDRDHTRARGLTTAASVWATAGVGIAAGLGRYVAAVGATILFVLVLRLLVHFDEIED